MDYVVVTGASGGLGRHAVKHFTSKGFHVFAIDSVESNERNAEYEGRRTFLHLDLCIPEEVDAAVEKISASCQAIECLINCAGIFVPDEFGPSAWTILGDLWKGNVVSNVMLTLQLQNLLEAGRHPLVLNIASTDAIVASAGQKCEIGVSHDLFYSLTKGAIVTFTRALAMKWAPLGIRVNALCPTIFESPMTAPLLSIPGKAQELSSHLPLGRLCTTTDLVAAIDAVYQLQMTTGHLIPVDAGYLCQ